MTVALPILMYHRVAPLRPEDKFAHLCVSPERFDEHLRLIARQGWRAVGAEELIATVSADCGWTVTRSDGRLVAGRQPDRQSPARPLAITFDDGMEDLCENAMPRLREAGLRPIVFLVAGLMGEPAGWLSRPDSCPPPRLVSWEQAQELGAAGFEFGGHTLTHCSLPELSREDKLKEIRDCKKIIEDKLGCEAPLFCYPFGHLDEETVDLVRETGYRAAVTTCRGSRHRSDDLFTLARIPVHQQVSPFRLRYRLSGWYGLKYALRRWLRG